MNKNQIYLPFLYNSVWLASLSVIIVTMISCGGSDAAKGISKNFVKSNDTSQHIIKIIENSRHQSPSEQKYPYGSGSTICLNGSTSVIDGITLIRKDGSGEKIIFPNKRVIRKNDFPILRDFPLEYDLKPNENYGYYDLKKMSVKKKRELFSNMDGYNPDKVKNYIKAELSCVTYGLTDTTSERVYIVTDMLIIEEEKRSEDDIFWYSVGRIGRMDIYDKKGNKLHEIKLDKYGCSGLCITPDKKYIIINSIGNDDSGNYHVTQNAAITIWSYDNPKLIDLVLHYPSYVVSNGHGCSDNYAGLKLRVPNTELTLNIDVIIDKKIVSTFLYPSSKEYKLKFQSSNKGSYLFDDGKVIKEGSPDFNQYSIQEWNALVIAKKTNLNETD